MGGCRCTFRGCPNNSANAPGTHFFHYPLKCPARYQQWLKYADTKHFENLPTSQARNKVVCEMHFRDECFMNYKKERLIQFAIPTLVRLPNGMVLDFEECEHPKPKHLEPTKSKHLINPEPSTSKNFIKSPQYSEVEEFVFEEIDDNSMNQSKKRPLTHCDVGNENIKRKPPVFNTPPKILNTGVRQFPPSRARQNPSRINAHAMHSTSQTLVDDLSEEVTIEEIPDTEISTPTKSFDLMLQDPHESEEMVQLENDVIFEKMIEVEKFDKNGLDNIVNEYETTIKNLQAKLAEKKEIEIIKTTQVETVSTSRAPVNNTSGALTKAQLFNGIKKYLSPSMATLVRMEMFGDSERQWKQDEKQVSVELLKLGDNIFDYFRDEWRFRLPSKKQVQQWLSACDNIDDDEDL